MARRDRAVAARARADRVEGCAADRDPDTEPRGEFLPAQPARRRRCAASRPALLDAKRRAPVPPSPIAAGSRGPPRRPSCGCSPAPLRRSSLRRTRPMEQALSASRAIRRRFSARTTCCSVPAGTRRRRARYTGSAWRANSSARWRGTASRRRRDCIANCGGSHSSAGRNWSRDCSSPGLTRRTGRSGICCRRSWRARETQPSPSRIRAASPVPWTSSGTVRGSNLQRVPPIHRLSRPRLKCLRLSRTSSTLTSAAQFPRRRLGKASRSSPRRTLPRKRARWCCRRSTISGARTARGWASFSPVPTRLRLAWRRNCAGSVFRTTTARARGCPAISSTGTGRRGSRCRRNRARKT